MKTLKEIIGLRKACQKNLAGINEKGLVVVFSVNVSSCEIWGGLGDRDEDDYYCINKDGWLKKSIITETGQYQKSNSGIISQNEHGINDETIQSILNGDCDMNAIRKFIDFFDNIHEKYSSDFN